MDRRHHHQTQDIQLARCSSPSDATGDSRRLEMCPSLYLAAYHGRVEEVMALLVQPRHRAAAHGDHQVNENDSLLWSNFQRGQCDLLEVSAESNNALHVAAEQGHGELIQELYHRFIKHGGFLSRRNSALDTPLHCAARAGRLAAVEVLLNLSRDSGGSILNSKNEAGDTALHLAARHGHGAAVEALVAARASASELNNAGVSPLYLAVMSRSVTAVRAITTSTCGDASSDGPSSQNALHAAVFQSSEMVDLILKWKPSLAGQVDVDGSSPLHFASSDGDRSIVSAIVRAAPPATVFSKDSDGLSAIHVAARMGHHHVVKELVKAWPDAAELRDGHGRTFLHAAAKNGHASVISLAIKNPMLAGLINAQDKDGNTALHLAVASAASPVSKGLAKLLSAGETLRTNIMNNDGCTPFDLAAKSSSFLPMISLVVTLTANGAKFRPQRQDQVNPWKGRRDTTEWIRKTSNSLAVVAILIATVAFSATFNVPGGYGDDGKAVLRGKTSYNFFVLFDGVAMTVSVAAVMLLVYAEASASWESFIFGLHCLWFSLISMVVAFWAALAAVTGRTTINTVTYQVINLGFYFLVCFIVYSTQPATSSTSMVKFMWSRLFSPRRHRSRVSRHYPLAGAFLRNLSAFVVVNILAYIGAQIAVQKT
ncbi:ankyrin repeat-containing protein ITN1-like isoform X1 [Oryza brachyantha]|nr:ankyrin repeat-containing protein ITN1-like isoform X1 [Oryza brachyantha]